MHPSIKTPRLVLVLATLTLSACGGGGGGGGGGMTASQPETSGPDDTMVTEPENTTPENTTPENPEPTSPQVGDRQSPTPVYLKSFGGSPVEALFSSLAYHPASDNYIGINSDDAALIRHVSRPGSVHQPTTGRRNVDIRTRGSTGTLLQSYPNLPAPDRGFFYTTSIRTVEISAGYRTIISLDGNGAYRPSEKYPESEFAGWTKGYEGKKGKLYYHAGRPGLNFYADHIGVIGDRSSDDDYLAWGYWLRSEGGTRFGTFRENLDHSFEVGAFIGGPGFTPRASNARFWRRSAGTATYSGESRGIFHQQYDSSPEFGEYASAIELGEYVQPFSIEVDFATGSVDLCGGCGGATTISVDGRRQDGTYYRYEGPAISFFQYEATTTVGNEGTFNTSTVSLTGTHPGNPIINHRGRIQGIFSMDRDGKRRPVMAIGTSGSSYEYQDGTEGYFIGTFGAKVDDP